MKKYVITIILLFMIILASIGGYFIYTTAKTNSSNDINTLREKCTSEIKFLSASMITMMNELNNISYSKFEIVNEKIDLSDNGQENSIEGDNTINSSNVVANNILNTNKNKIDWNNLKNEIENMYSDWTTIMIDLTTLNVNKNNLLKYNSLLDQITKDLENEDKQSSLLHLADLHNLLSLYIKDFESDNNIVSLLKVKTNILYSYSFVNTEAWDKVVDYISKAKYEFSNIINNQINNINDIDVINKSYILINELEKNSSNKDKNIFYINYINLMQELDNID